MAYDSTIPQASDKIKDSQPQILANFSGIKTLVDINHVTFDDPNEGKHKYVSMPEQSSAPTVAANELALFSQEGTYTSVSELAFRRESSGDVVEFTGAGKTNVGWTILPSGILIKWGRSSSSTGTTNITWPTGATIPVFSTVYTVVLTPLNATAGDIDSAVRLISFSTTQISIYISKRTTTGAATTGLSTYFVAIGLPA